MSVLDAFVAFDLETTGLNPEHAEIIEMGAVKVRNGEVTERFSQLIKPEHHIPLRITRLTGISNEDVRDAPDIYEALPAFYDFIEDHPLVAHDASFDRAFLEQYGPLPDHLYDSLELARVVLPRLINHKLETLLKCFQIELKRAHRAEEDARGVALVLLALIDLLKDKGLAVVQWLVLLGQESSSNLYDLFVALVLELSRGALRTKIRTHRVDPNYLRAFFNVGGVGEPEKPAQRTSDPLNAQKLRSLFDEGGRLQQRISGYELREQQIQMMEGVCEAFSQSAFLVVEAGTGTGKSLAYLVPAIHWAIQNHERVVVSTNTKNLQEQLFYKDIPELQSALEVPFLSVLLKGRSNYLCLNKWYTALSQLNLTFTPQERKAALPLVIWLEETETGDIAENNGFQRTRNTSLWNKVCSETGYCLGQKCKHYRSCFLMNIRRTAVNAHIVVVNHSLLFSDLASENAILTDYQNLILDEAHNVEKVATHYLGRDLSIWRIRNLVNRLYAREVVEIGVLVSLRQYLDQAKSDAPFETQITRLIELCQSVWRDGQDLFDAVVQMMSEHLDTETPYSRKIRYKAEQQVFEPLSPVIQDFLTLLTRLGSELEMLVEWLKDLPNEAFTMQDEITANLEGRLVDVADIANDLAFLTEAEDDAYVYWLELPSREKSYDVRLYAAPLDISEHLSTELYDRLRTIVFTSATLTIQGRFQYFLRRLGLDQEHQERVQMLAVGSPFDYEHQVLVAVPAFVPSPKSPTFSDAVEEVIEALTTKIKRGTLVLFTAYGMLNRSYNTLKEKLEMEDIQLLGQGRDGSRTRIIDEFREDASSVLFGTDSFWEGVDVAGAALEMLILVKLPFAVPSEPIVAAQMERLEKQGKNSFMYYSVPEAVIRFRQGFGRLIRNKTDQGIVIILDHRVIKSRYGEVFLNSLPTKTQSFSSQQAMITEIKRWFDVGR